MKVLTALTLGLSIAVTALAQPIPPQDIEGQLIGWRKVRAFKDATAPVVVDGRTYSARQLSIGRNFANWMQASYEPRGALGDVRVTVLPKIGLYDPETAALPQSYGAVAKLYTDLKYDASRKFVPASDSHIVWAVMANEVIGWPAGALNTPTQFYFVLPTFTEQGFDAQDEEAADLSQHPFLRHFPAYFHRNSKTGNRKYVVLTRDRRLPFATVSKGEYLAVMEGGIARSYEEEKTKIARDYADDRKGIDYFMRGLNQKLGQRLASLERNKRKYAARLAERAEIFTLQPDVMLENYDDVFEGNGGGDRRLPVYKIDPAVLERCKTDAPQWIVVSWTAVPHDPASRHLHEAMVSKFNFEYLHSHFFAPDKVAGVPYKPLRP